MNILLNGFALGLGPQEMIIMLVVVLLLFGAKKIPELMRGVGQGVGQLQKGLEEGKKNLNASIEAEAHAEGTTAVEKANNADKVVAPGA